MHICIAASYWPTQSNPISGIFIRQQLDAFLKLGHQVSLILPGRDNINYDGLADFAGNQQFRVFYARQTTLPLEPFPKISLPQNLKFAEKAYIRQVIAANLYRPIQALHIQDLTYPLGAAIQARQQFQFPIFTTIHGEHPSLVKTAEMNPPPSDPYLQACHRVIIVGNSLREYAKSMGASDSQLTVIPNGAIDFDPNPSDIHNLRIQSNPKRVILTVCNLVENKGVDTLARALFKLQDLPNWTWRIIGDGEERKPLEKLIRELQLTNRVQFYGRLPHYQTLTHMSAADIFVMPSHRESFGIVFVEAMKHGCPAIGCKGTGAEEIITPNHDGYLVDPGDDQAIALKLRSWISDQPAYSEVSKNAKLTGQKFSWHSNAKQYIELFNSSN